MFLLLLLVSINFNTKYLAITYEWITCPSGNIQLYQDWQGGIDLNSGNEVISTPNWNYSNRTYKVFNVIPFNNIEQISHIEQGTIVCIIQIKRVFDVEEIWQDKEIVTPKVIIPKKVDTTSIFKGYKLKKR